MVTVSVKLKERGVEKVYEAVRFGPNDLYDCLAIETMEYGDKVVMIPMANIEEWAYRNGPADAEEAEIDKPKTRSSARR